MMMSRTISDGGFTGYGSDDTDKKEKEENK